MAKPEVRIAVLGCGTVGSQVVRLLLEAGDDYELRCQARLSLSAIVVRDAAAARPDFVPRGLLTTDAEGAIDGADLVIELIGGIDPARAWVLRALRAGKTVVTGNKALLAQHGPELYDAAAASDASLYFEAAVAGAVPVVYGLRESLAGDRVNAVRGIVNGTTNYILDQMASHGLDYDQALAQAQQLGFAEADPSADVDGLDAAAKCAILASLAFHTRVGIADVAVRGIRDVTAADIAAAAYEGYTIKLLAHAERSVDAAGCPSVAVRVEPTLVGPDNPLASVAGAFNAVVIDADAAGRLMFYGQGAGGVQTASAVLGDVVAGALHIAHGGSAPHESAYESLPVLSADQVVTGYQLRLAIADDIGVLAQVAGILADAGISVATVHQGEDQGGATLTMTTHPTRAGALDAAVARLRECPAVDRVLAVYAKEGN